MIENLVSVTPDDYARLLPTPSTAFGTAAFNMLNSAKVSRIEFLAGLDSDSRPLMGMIAGLRDGIWRTPFSAPMAALSWNRDLSLATIESFFARAKEYFASYPLRIVLPPAFIAPQMLASIIGITANMASSVTFDYNYHYDLSLTPEFEKHLKPKARNKYHQAQKSDFTFESVDIARAYAVIAANRTAKGYYLAMTLADLEATSSIIGIDAFILSHRDFEHLRPMNILPYHIFTHYHALGFTIVNIGTSSTDGIPNHGLCSFKESLGCTLSLIPTITIHNA